MKPLFVVRLLLDLLAVGLLLAALAYDGSGNLAHEIIGTTMLALLIGHNLFNRRWYGTIARGRPEPRTLLTRGVNLSLLVSMLALLATSLIISEAVFSFLPFTSTVGARQIHMTVGYLALLIVAVHLGLHWTMIMGVALRLLGITSGSRLRTSMLRLVAIGLAAYGLYSLVVVNIGSKLLMEMSLMVWDFEREAAAFLLHHAAIVALGAVIGHYGSQLCRRHDRTKTGGHERVQ